MLGAAHGRADTPKSGSEILEVVNQRISNISMWLTQQKVVIAGDITFHQRLLPG